MRLVALLVFAGTLMLAGCPVLPGPLTWILPLAALAPFARHRATQWVLLLCAGYCWAWLNADAALRDRIVTDAAGTDYTLDGVVRALPSCRGRVCRFVVDIEASEPGGMQGRRVRLSWYDATRVPSTNERWRLKARLRAPRGFANPGTFDYEAWLFRQRIDATGYVRDSGANGPLPSNGAGAWADALRANVGLSLRESLGPREGAAVILALVTGDRRDLTQAQWDTLSRTGTGHLMAISGLHIGLVAGAVFFAATRLGRFAPPSLRLARRRGFAAACALLAATAYALLAGFTLPTRRALVMAAVVLTALTLRRPMALTRSLSAALLAAMVVAPLGHLDPGFWLSFGAVAAIGLAFAGRPAAVGVKAFGRTQWAVTIGLMPVVAGLFGQVPVVSPLANAMLIPLFSMVIVPLALMGAVVNAVVPSVGVWLLAAAATSIELAWIPLDAVAAVPWAVVRVPGRPTGLLILAAVGVAALIGPRGPMPRVAAVALLVPMLVWRPASPPAGGFDMAVLDVGQGLAVLVRTRSHALVYDAGPAFRAGGDAGRSVVVPYIDARHGRSPDLIVISHGDSDHIGGAQTLIDRYPDALRLGDALVGARPCTAGQSWTWDGVRFEIVLSRSDRDSSDNDRSCVLAITAGTVTALLPGDIEAAAESSLLSAMPGIRAQIVVVPHHGSNTSSTPAFVTALDARYALVSAGHANRWGHPTARVVDRWRKTGATVLSTAVSGAIVVRVGPSGRISRPYRHRVDGGRLWTARDPPAR